VNQTINILMLFNNDSMLVVGSVILIVAGIFISSKYNIFTTDNKVESLVNTLPKLDSDLQLANLPSHSYTDASVQTVNINLEAGVQTANQYVNTGMQTSARMWLESIRNRIEDILSSSPQVSGQYVDAAVQTNTISTYQIVKNWFREVCSIRSSELTDLGQKKKLINGWIN